MKPALRFLLTLLTILCCTTIAGAAVQDLHAGVVFEETCVYEGKTHVSSSLVAPKSEVTNAFSSLGRNFSSKNLNTLDEFGSGAAFSGVYNPQSGKFLAYASGETRLATGGVPGNLVPRRGGHAAVNRQFSEILGVSRGDNVGFTMFLDDAGDISVDWLSRSVNGMNRSFDGVVVPQSMRQSILDSISTSTGRGVRSR